MTRRVPDALARAARAEGRRRSAGLGEGAPRPDAPRGGPSPASSCLEQRVVDGRRAWFLDGVQVRVGDVVELYTNAANGWLRGRFEWSERADDRPRLAVNLWNPSGLRDEDGLPPWVGTLEADLPSAARLRWPQGR